MITVSKIRNDPDLSATDLFADAVSWLGPRDQRNHDDLAHQDVVHLDDEVLPLGRVGFQDGDIEGDGGGDGDVFFLGQGFEDAGEAF